VGAEKHGIERLAGIRLLSSAEGGIDEKVLLEKEKII
jgi:hypothetical protein